MKTCPACDAFLSRSDLESGWCDGCGKKLPESIRQGVYRDVDRAVARTERYEAAESRASVLGTVLTILAILVIVPVILFAVVAGGPDFFVRLVLRIGIVVVISVVIAVCSAGKG